MADVNIGAAPNDGTGDPLRAAFSRLNINDRNHNDALIELTKDVGKIISSRHRAVYLGQARLPAIMGVIITMEGSNVVVRGAFDETDDPLFPTSPRWGVVVRIKPVDDLINNLELLVNEKADSDDVDQLFTEIQRADEGIVLGPNGKPLLDLDAGGNPIASVFRETRGTGLPATEVTIISESGGRDTLRSSAKGLLFNAASESLDDANLAKRFEGPWVLGETWYREGIASAKVNWLGANIKLESDRRGRPIVSGAKKIYGIIGIGQSDQGIGDTGSWVTKGLAPHSVYMLNNEYSDKLGAATSGFGDMSNSGHGSYTAFGMADFRNPTNQQSLIDACAARLSHLQSMHTGTSDLFVTVNVSAGGATMNQMREISESIWSNTMIALDQIKSLGDFYGMPVELLAFDFRQGFGDRSRYTANAYVTKVEAYEADLAAAVVSKFPTQSYRPYFVMQQVADAVPIAPNDDGNGPALGQIIFARNNTHGNVLHVPSTIFEQHEFPGTSNVHATEWAYVANGEHAARAIYGAHFGGYPVSSPWNDTDVGTLTGLEFRYPISATMALTIANDKVSAAFKVVSANSVTVTKARLEERGMLGNRITYDVVLTLSGAPGTINYITHAYPNVAVYLSAVAAIRSREPTDLVFATKQFHRSRLGPYDSYVPGDLEIPVPSQIWDWMPYHKIGV